MTDSSLSKRVFFKIVEAFRLNRIWRKRPPSPDNGAPLRVALICIAKDEDNYINEWIDYHLKLGVDEIFIYQNDWRMKPVAHPNVHLIEFDGDCKQLAAYNDFIINRSTPFDFGIFIDVDEFVCLIRDKDIKRFLLHYVEHAAVGLNWRFFGDNGRKDIGTDGYSLLKRFTRCGKKLNKHIKTIVNFKRIPADARFSTPHHISSARHWYLTVSTDLRYYIHGYFHSHFNYDIAWLNHYRGKTLAEFKSNKKAKGRSDLPRSNPDQVADISLFVESNLNDMPNTTALDFFIREPSE